MQAQGSSAAMLCLAVDFPRLSRHLRYSQGRGFVARKIAERCDIVAPSRSWSEGRS